MFPQIHNTRLTDRVNRMKLVRAATCCMLLCAILMPVMWHYNLLKNITSYKHNDTQHEYNYSYAHASTEHIHTLSTTPIPLPTICILIPATSAKQAHWLTLKDTFLYTYPLSSIYATCELNLFIYRILVGYDTGDRVFDNQTTLGALHEWAAHHIPFIALTTHPVSNPLCKPGPVMNRLSKLAHVSGCDYIYRINDDTEFITPWTTAFVAALAAFSPPNIGVVGPVCHEGNTDILTHDFVHRSHLDIFGTHYPPELTDWWLDDWISLVYGDNRTLKLPQVTVFHHVLTTRYEVTWNSIELLQALVEKGNKTLSEFISNKRISTYVNPSQYSIALSDERRGCVCVEIDAPLKWHPRSRHPPVRRHGTRGHPWRCRPA